MKLWLLRPKGYGAAEGWNNSDTLWGPWWDRSFGFVIRAPSPKAARLLASERSGDESPGAWLSPRTSTCKQLTNKGSLEIIVRDFWSA